LKGKRTPSFEELGRTLRRNARKGGCLRWRKKKQQLQQPTPQGKKKKDLRSRATQKGKNLTKKKSIQLDARKNRGKKARSVQKRTRPVLHKKKTQGFVVKRALRNKKNGSRTTAKKKKSSSCGEGRSIAEKRGKGSL